MLPIQIDHVTQNKDRLLWQWRDSPNIQGLVESYSQSLNDLEDMFFDLLDNRNIDNGVGYQLDVIGELIGEPRDLRDDPDYRKALKYKSLIARSSGTPNQLLEILAALSETNNVNLWEHYPGNIHMYADGGVNAFVVRSLDRAVPAAVSMRLMFDDGGNSFIGSDFVNEPFTLIRNGGDIIQVSDEFGVDYDLQVISVGAAASGYERSILPELFVEGYLEHYEATFTGTTELTQAVTFLNNKQYAISYKVNNTTVGSVKIEIRGSVATITGQVTTADGVVNEVLVVVSGHNTVAIVPSVDWDGDITDFSIWQVPSQTDLQNPLCEVIDKDISTESFSFLITDIGDNLVDDNTNSLIAII